MSLLQSPTPTMVQLGFSATGGQTISWATSSPSTTSFAFKGGGGEDQNFDGTLEDSLP